MSVRAPEIVLVVFQILQLHLIEFAWRRATEPMEQFQRSKPRPSGTSGRLNQRLKVFERSQILFESMSGYICHMMTNTHSIPPFLHTPLSLPLSIPLSSVCSSSRGDCCQARVHHRLDKPLVHCPRAARACQSINRIQKYRLSIPGGYIIVHLLFQ